MLWRWFSDDSLKLMLTALFLAPELFDFYGDAVLFRSGISSKSSLVCRSVAVPPHFGQIVNSRSIGASK